MRTVRRRLLFFALAAIAVTAALGIYAVAVPHFGRLQANVLGTSASVSGASILALACYPAWERRRLGIVPVVAAFASAAAFALIVIGMWSGTDRAAFWKAMGTALVVGLWGSLSSLLALARLAPRYRWAFGAAVGLGLLLATLGIAGFWSEPSSGAYVRVVAGVAVLLAAFTLAVPILHRASRGELAEGEPTDIRFCPRCGRSLSGEADSRITCPACGARFSIRFLDGT